MRNLLARLVMAFSLVAFVGAAACQPATVNATTPAASSPTAGDQRSIPNPAGANVMAVPHAAPAAPERVTISVDADLLLFLKIAGGVVTVLVAVFAGIGVIFFGWDVHKTRGAMYEARDDLHKRMEDIRKDHQALRELKERLEKLGAELVEVIEKKSPPKDSASPESPTSGPTPGPAPKPGPTPSPQTAPPPSSSSSSTTTYRDTETGRFYNRFDSESVDRFTREMRQHIGASDFEWTTVQTLARKMSLSESAVLDLAKRDPFVELGTGRNGAVLVRLREIHAPPGEDWNKWMEAVQRNLERGKGPTRKDPF